MQCNETIHGFTVTRIRPAEEQEGTLYEFTHDRTGAKLAWLSRAEENKSFCIAFATIPDNDSGMFHILEHSVLNGSDRYPVKAPFVELMKSSLQTFLNALTYPDRTAYPLSSRNEKDFENLVRIYMDAVLHPRIYSCPEIFYQEGWHYEPAQDQNGYIRNGVVFSEMKGVFSSVDSMLMSEMCRLLYPDTCYQYESGGHPEHIPELTYEQFINYHKTYYHPSNAHIFLDGDLPIETMLGILDQEYLSAYDRKEVDVCIPLQGKTGFAQKTGLYPAMPGVPKDQAAQMMFGYLTGRFDEKERQYAMSLLANYLAGDNDAPLKKAILGRGLAQDVEMTMNDGIKQPALLLILRNTDDTKKDEIRAVIREVFEKLVKDGIDRKRMASAINNMEFHVREQDYRWMPSGVGLALDVMGSWIYGEDPIRSLTSSEAFSFLRSELAKGYFEKLIDEVLVKNENSALVCLTPSETIAAENQKKEADEIARITGAWGEKEKEAAAKQFESLRLRQNTPDTPEQLASIPLLQLSDVAPKPGRIATKETKKDGVAVLTHPLPTRGVQYLRLYFPLPKLSKEDLPKVSVLCMLLGQLETEHYSAEELKVGMKADLGSFGVSGSNVQDRERPELCRPLLQVSVSVLKENTGRALSYTEEVLLHTRFTDLGRIRDILAQNLEGLRQSLVAAGHQYGMYHAAAHNSAAGVVNECTSGYTFYKWLQNTLADFEQNGRALAGELEKLCGRIFTGNGLTISLTGEEDETAAQRLGSLFPVGGEKPETVCYTPEPYAKDGIEIPSDVAYAIQSGHLSRFNIRTNGTMKVLAKYLTLNYLWQMIRVQGGAYGTGLSFSDNGSVALYSYRDPNAQNSLSVYAQMPEFMQQAFAQPQDITGIILGTISDEDPLLPPKVQGQIADMQYFAGTSYEERCRMWKEILEATPERLNELSGVLKKVLDCENICVVGGTGQLEKCKIQNIQKM